MIDWKIYKEKKWKV